MQNTQNVRRQTSQIVVSGSLVPFFSPVVVFQAFCSYLYICFILCWLADSCGPPPFPPPIHPSTLVTKCWDINMMWCILQQLLREELGASEFPTSTDALLSDKVSVFFCPPPPHSRTPLPPHTLCSKCLMTTKAKEWRPCDSCILGHHKQRDQLLLQSDVK